MNAEEREKIARDILENGVRGETIYSTAYSAEVLLEVLNAKDRSLREAEEKVQAKELEIVSLLSLRHKEVPHAGPGRFLTHTFMGMAFDDFIKHYHSLTAQLSESQKEVKKLKSWQLTPHNFNLMYEQEEKIKALQASLEEAQRERDEAYEKGYKDGENNRDEDWFVLLEEDAGIIVKSPLGAVNGFKEISKDLRETEALLESSKVREERLREALNQLVRTHGEPCIHFPCDALNNANLVLAEGKGEA